MFDYKTLFTKCLSLEKTVHMSKGIFELALVKIKKNNTLEFNLSIIYRKYINKLSKMYRSFIDTLSKFCKNL